MKKPRFGIVTAVVLLTSIVCWPSVASSADGAPVGQNAEVAQSSGSVGEDQPAGPDRQSVRRTEEILQGLAVAGAIPSDLQDPAFDRYVDLTLLGSAWADLDASLMTDVVLQFMEGERVLLRPHKAVHADALMEVAVRLATIRNDREALERLAKASKLRGSESLSAQIAEARNTLAQEKPSDPSQNIPIESLSAEAFALYKACLLDIDAAVVARDAHALEVLAEELPRMSTLPQKHRAMLQQKIEAARKSFSDKEQQPNMAASILDKLAATTRSGWQLGPDAGFPVYPEPGPGPQIITPDPLDVDDGIRQGGPHWPDTPTYPDNPPGTLIPPVTTVPPTTWTPPRYPPSKRPPYYPPNYPPRYPPNYPPQQQQQQWIPPQPPQPPGKRPPTPPPGKWQGSPGWQSGGQFLPEEGFSRRYYMVD